MSCSKCDAESSVLIYETQTELCWNCYGADEKEEKQEELQCLLCRTRGMLAKAIIGASICGYPVWICEDCTWKFRVCIKCNQTDFIRDGLCMRCNQYCYFCLEDDAYGLCDNCRHRLDGYKKNFFK